MQYIFGWVMVIAAIFVEPEIAERMREASDLTQEHADGMTGAVC